MTLRERIARWAIKGAGDRMTAEQLVQTVFGKSVQGMKMGSAELLQAYSTMPWLRAVGERISWSVATPSWQLFAAKTAPKAGGRYIKRSDLAASNDPNYRLKQYKALRAADALREITDHPVLTLLEKGNNRFDGSICRQVTQLHLDLVGEGAWVLEMNGLLLPSEIYPIPPTWIAQTPWDYANNDVWIINTPRGTKTLPRDQLIYFYHPDPYDPYSRGRGTGHALGDDLETDKAVSKHVKRWFENFAIPPMIVWRKGGGTGATTGKPNTERMEENWMKKLMGRNNVPYFSNQEIGVQTLNTSFNDMQLSELRKDQRDILVHVYGMPPEIFGILENSNRSTIDAADYLMAKYVVVPRLEFKRRILQEQLVNRFDDRLILDYVSPVMEDKDYKLKVLTAAPYALSEDEIRELIDKPPLPNNEGTGFWVPPSASYVRKLDEAGVAASEPTNPITE